MQRTIAKCGEGHAIPQRALERPLSQQAWNPAHRALALAARARATAADLGGIYDGSYLTQVCARLRRTGNYSRKICKTRPFVDPTARSSNRARA